MQLTEDDIMEYKALYRRHFGETLTDDEAWKQAHNLIHFMRLITELPPDAADSKVTNKGKTDPVGNQP